MRRLQATAFALLGLAAPLLAVFEARLLNLLLLGGGLLGPPLMRLATGRWPRFAAPGLPLLLLLAWAGLACLWSFEPRDAVERWITVACLGLGGLSLALSAERPPAAARRALLVGLLAGIGAALACFVVWRLGPPEALFEMNRAVSLLALLAWPLAVALPGAWRVLPPLLAFTVALPMDSQASVAGLALGLALAALAWLSPAAGRAAALLALAVALVAGPFLLLQLQHWGWDEAGWLPNTARYRVQIWGFATERLLERPLWGWGFEASRAMPNFGVVSIMGNETVIPNHPHNALLQLWLELGLPALLLVLWLLGALVLRIARLPRAEAALGLGLFGTALGIALLAYGAWQGHSLALWFLAAAAFVALRPAASPPPPPHRRPPAP